MKNWAMQGMKRVMVTRLTRIWWAELPLPGHDEKSGRPVISPKKPDDKGLSHPRRKAQEMDEHRRDHPLQESVNLFVW